MEGRARRGMREGARSVRKGGRGASEKGRGEGTRGGRERGERRLDQIGVAAERTGADAQVLCLGEAQHIKPARGPPRGV